jgi:hypothetical protein
MRLSVIVGQEEKDAVAEKSEHSISIFEVTPKWTTNSSPSKIYEKRS